MANKDTFIDDINSRLDRLEESRREAERAEAAAELATAPATETHNAPPAPSNMPSMVVNRQQQQQQLTADPSSSASVSISSAEHSESPRNRCKSESLSVERQSPPAAQTAASALAERAARLSTRLKSSSKSPNAAMQAVFRARHGDEVLQPAAPAQGPSHTAAAADGLEYLSKVELAAMVRQLRQREATSAASEPNNSRLNLDPDFTPRRVVTGINSMSGKSTIVCDGPPPELLPDGRVQVPT